MKRRFLIPVLLVSILVSISSCGEGDVYKQYKELPNYTWERIEKGKSVVFEGIDIKEEEETYDVSVLVRHTPWINEDEIKFKMLITSPSGITRESVHSVRLKDRDGKAWAGDALGDLIDLEEVCRRYISFPEKGLYTVELVNMGSKYQTTGLMELGLKIEKSDLEIKTSK